MSMEESDDDFKEFMQKATKQSGEPSKEVLEKIEEIKVDLLAAIDELKDSDESKIPFKKLNDKTGYDYQIISDILLILIQEGELLGFIQDQGTEGLEDDLLILRKERFVDSLEPDYRTG